MFGKNKSKKQEIKKAYGIYYLYDGRMIDIRKASKRGFSISLINAIGIASYHIARDDYYPKAIIVDRNAERIVRILNRTATGITIIERE